MDDLADLELKLKGINYIYNIEFKGNVDIIFRKNTELGEAATVRDYVVNTNEKNEMIFFCHTKGITTFRANDGKAKLNSITNWILTMYFYNLNFTNEVIEIFQGKRVPIEAFYGTLLMLLTDTKNYPVFYLNYIIAVHSIG